MKYGRKLCWKNSWYDFYGDGMFKKERFKGYWKRKMSKWQQKKLENEHFKSYED
jgi:hypothetical protein